MHPPAQPSSMHLSQIVWRASLESLAQDWQLQSGRHKNEKSAAASGQRNKLAIPSLHLRSTASGVNSSHTFGAPNDKNLSARRARLGELIFRVPTSDQRISTKRLIRASLCRNALPHVCSGSWNAVTIPVFAVVSCFGACSLVATLWSSPISASRPLFLVLRTYQPLWTRFVQEYDIS